MSDRTDATSADAGDAMHPHGPPAREPVGDTAEQAAAGIPEGAAAGALDAPAQSDSGSSAPRAAAYARLVAAGILLSRIAGLVRERIFAQYFGTSIAADAFKAALRGPNVLQNLLGEGTLSASFIPVYSELLVQGRREEAGRVAGAVFALLLAAAGLLSLIGIALAPVLVSVFTPGFQGEQRELTISAIRIIFPMTGTLVLSAWALGILNSHRRFFLAYFAPVLWNAAMIATLLYFGPRQTQGQLVTTLAWGAFAGGLLQFAIQLPRLLRLEPNLRIRWAPRMPAVRTVVRNAGPAIMGRGVVQLSGYLDLVLASLLAAGAFATITYASTIYLLPYSLFGMSIAAAELPELSRQRQAAKNVLRERVSAGLRELIVYVIPSFVAFILLGDILVGALYQTGEFERADTLLVWAVLAAYAIGLLASTSTRLYNSAFFALQDTKTPAKVAAMRVVFAAGIGAGLMFLLQRVSLAGQPLGPVGIALGAGAGAWFEWFALRRSLGRQLEGAPGAGAGRVAKLIVSATVAAVIGRGIDWLLPPLHPIVVAVIVLIPFGLVYFGLARALGVPEAAAASDRVLRRLRR